MINSKALGLAGGLLFGAFVFIFTFICMYTGYASMWSALLADLYPGYSITFGGAFLGLVYGFLNGSIGLFVLAWLYNKFNCKCSNRQDS
ncbi:bacteriophage holin [Waddlia chondrophila]|uniref:Membrane-associated protein n=1 Tax=Waddlia chondrophila (strain ATCC VR-1470 / WSU 86-1044) TaxID=716544 RepID=D6YV55_WADCW|nr:bacteriophage holin [Waddlia chondrophila]ADI38016.1 hypothetical protein wcw_0648 [Waddlia chondrophila WSU 86-1044]